MRAHWHGGLLFYTFPHFDACAGLRHAFSSRLGGVSKGGRESLNMAFLSPEEQPESGRENLRRFALAVGFDETRLVLTQQTHTVNIFEAYSADAGRGVTRPRGYTDIDGLITAAPNLPLMTHHADCAPLFFYAPRHRMIGLAHAGWRGTAGGMARAMVERLTARGCDPGEILAGIGPSAGPCCYQVGPEVAERFAHITDETEPMLKPAASEPGKFFLDLWRVNRAVMIEAGVKPENIVIGGLCTVCHPELFFSHRRQGLDRGSMAATVMLTED